MDVFNAIFYEYEGVGTTVAMKYNSMIDLNI